MATAKKVPAEFSIELTLSKAEAETLLRVTEKIGGFCYSCTVDEEAPRGKKLLGGGA